MMNYGVVRTDRMTGTTVPASLYSVRYINGSGKEAPIENGSVVALDGLYKTHREIFKGVDVKANTPISNVVLVASVETNYEANFNQLLVNLDDFINPAGANIRAYELISGDVFSLTESCFDDSKKPEVGDIVELTAGTKLKAVKSATPSSTTVGKIEAVEVAGRYTYFVIRVA